MDIPYQSIGGLSECSLKICFSDKVISASVMAAPTALAVSKLLYPETETSKTSVKDIQMPKATEANVLDAAAQGASNAIMLVLNIGASLIAFLAFVAFLDGLIGELLSNY